jgi:hypothetical protein
MSNSSQVGEISEMRVALAFRKAGYTILEPFGHQQPYDLVAEKDGEFMKIQAKSGRLTDGSVDVHVCTWQKDGSPREYEDYEIDYFGVFCKDTDEVYVVHVSEAPKQNMRLRVDDTNHHQVRMAEEYKAEKIL